MNRKPIRIAAFALLGAMATLAWPCLSVRAEARLPAIFADHMVLQRDMPITVWGWADPGEKVSVTLSVEPMKPGDPPRPVVIFSTSGSGPGDSITRQAVADEKGHWQVSLGVLPGAGATFRLKATSSNAIELCDILVGDVWFASGQSNMYWPVKDSADPEKEIAAADWPQIRSFDVWKDAAAEPRDDVYGKWQVCSPKTAGNFSAAAYYFARQLHKELKVPIGIVHASWAASSAHPWRMPPLGPTPS